MTRIFVAAVAVLAALAGPAAAKDYGYKAPSYSAPRPQPAYQNAGKISPTTNLPMTKPVSGYIKQNGTYVAPYMKSK